MNKSIFKQYDIRGIADTDLTDSHVKAIAGGLAAFFRQQGEHKVIVCQDVRDSSPRVANTLIRALADAGMDVLDIGVHPTPVCYFATHKLQISACVMVTASHNPAEYNGMKINSRYASIYGDDIQQILRLSSPPVSSGGAPAGNGEAPAGSISKYESIEEDYINYICERIRPTKRLRIGIDAGNGTAGPVARRLYERLGCEVHDLYCDPDPAFPNHHPDPTIPANLDALQRLVLDEGLDMGLAFDGDGDRLGVVDDRGEILWGDSLQILFWRDIMPRHPGSEVIVEVKCSQALYEEALRLGGKPFFYKTGHSLIKAKMKEKGLLFAGEMSGHMFFADEYLGYDDALYAGARLVRLLADKGRVLSREVADMPRYYATPEIRLDCPDERKRKLMQDITAHFVDGGADVITVDGVRVIFEDGWGLLRQSNTQPIIVMRAESKTPEGLQRIRRTMEQTYAAFISK